MLLASCSSVLSVGRAIVSYARLSNGSQRSRISCFLSRNLQNTSRGALLVQLQSSLVTPSAGARPKKTKHFPKEVSGVVTLPSDFDKTQSKKA